MEIFRQLHLAGHTLVMVTHDPDVGSSADRIVRLDNGRVADHVKNRSGGLPLPIVAEVPTHLIELLLGDLAPRVALAQDLQCPGARRPEAGIGRALPA